MQNNAPTSLNDHKTYSLLLNDLGFFNEQIRGLENSDHHIQWCGILDNNMYQDGNGDLHWCEDGQKVNNRWIILEAPRNHSKSTIFTVTYPLREIARDHNVRIVICSSAASQSESFLREITTEIEGNEEYQRWFGVMKPQIPTKWTDKEIIVERSGTNLKDPTVSATSMGGTVLSKRADIIICDDILSYENCRTAERRQKVRQWFLTVLLPVLEPGGRLIIVGTAWNNEDLYHQLLEDTEYDIRLIYQAVLDEEALDPEEQTLWPKRWPLPELLKLKRSMGSKEFNQAYQNIVQSAEDAVFKLGWLHNARKKGTGRLLLNSFDYAYWDLGEVTKGGGVDLAISKKEDADETALAVIARTQNGTKIPLWLEVGKYSLSEAEARIVRIYERYQLLMIKVENNGYQEALRRDMAEHTDIPIQGYTTGGEKFDPEIGINSLAVEFENEKWILPYPEAGDESPDAMYTKKMIDRLIEGLLAFPAGHTDDLVMAVWFANTAIRDLTVSTKQGEAKVGTLNIFNR